MAGIPQVIKEDSQPVRTVGYVLDAALDAYRAGTLDSLLRQYPAAANWLTQRYLKTIYGTAGDAIPPEKREPSALAWMLEWVVTQLRPDRTLSFDIPNSQFWLDRTSWRPAIAVMCHYGFAPVPEFRDRYYRRPGESPADNLCGLWNVGQSSFTAISKRANGRCLGCCTKSDWIIVTLRRCGAMTSCKLRFHCTIERSRTNRMARQTVAHLFGRKRLSIGGLAFGVCEDFLQFSDVALRHLTALSTKREFENIIEQFLHQATRPSAQVQFRLIQAATLQLRQEPQRELDMLQDALKVAVGAQDHLATGIVYGRLGKYYETREANRAFAYYQDSIDFLSQVDISTANTSFVNATNEYADTIAKLAWLYMLRNDPRAKVILDHIETFRSTIKINDAANAMLEQVWGGIFGAPASSTKRLNIVTGPCLFTNVWVTPMA